MARRLDSDLEKGDGLQHIVNQSSKAKNYCSNPDGQAAMTLENISRSDGGDLINLRTASMLLLSTPCDWAPLSRLLTGGTRSSSQ